MARTKKSGGFTLIELLVVIAIIAILASLVLSTAGYIQKKAARARAEAEIQALSTALESYKVEYGDYPESASVTHSISTTTGANILYIALVGVDTNLNPLKKVFFEPSKGNSYSTNYGSSANYFQDPFGQPYQYQYKGDANKSGTNFFDLWSYGGSTKTTTTDTNHWETWVKNW